MTYTLRGDRKVEYGFALDQIPFGPGWCLDVGPGPNGQLAVGAIERKWNVVGVDLTSCRISHEQFMFLRMDFLNLELVYKFGLILNVSTIEHFGIPGRYGVKEFDEDADLRAMDKIRGLMAPGAKMILTLPAGKDAVLAPFHRVYGRERLPRLLDGYHIIGQKYWAKLDDVDVFKKVPQNTALNVKPLLEPHHYYAIGGFVLEAADG